MSVSQVILIFCILLTCWRIEASCGTTTYTWQGSNTNWNTNSNWSPVGRPDTSSENAVLSATNNLRAEGHTIGCFDAQSGKLLSQAGGLVLSITGDYFKALNPNTLQFTTSHDFTIQMSGSSDQTFEAVDSITNLDINNPNKVTITQPGRVMRNLTFSETGTVFDIDSNGQWEVDRDVTIPSSVTVRVLSGSTWYMNGNLSVDGVLIIEGGAALRMGTNRTISVNSGAIMKLTGSNGNVSTVQSSGAGNFFYLNIAGIFEANYFRLDGLRNGGVNVTTGVVSSLSNGEFRNARTSTDYITLGSSATFPTSISGLAFYDDYAYGNLINVNASAYSGALISFDDYSGSIAGASFELDPQNRIDWLSPASTSLSLVSNTPANMPGNSNSQSSGEKVYGVFNASLNQIDTTTNITDIKITLSGTASASDLSYLRLYDDSNGNCSYDSGVDLQIGSDQILSGVPASASFSVPIGVLSTSGPGSPICFIVTAEVNATAQDGKTVKLGIEGSSDLVNDQNYSFSPSSGPPVYGNQTVLVGTTQSKWRGTKDSLYSRGANWLGQPPTLANGKDCEIGVGTNVPVIDVSPSYCRNASLISSGSLDFGGVANIFSVTGNLNVESGFTFLNATNASIEISGSGPQQLNLSQNFPGNLLINSGEDVLVSADSSISGNLVLANGTLTIPSGVSLTIGGDLSVSGTSELIVLAGGTIKLGDGSSLLVSSGATLTIVGESGNRAAIEGVNNSSALNVVVSGAISAKYYKISNLSGSGLSIESSASIDPNNNLSYGSFDNPSRNDTVLLTLKKTHPGATLMGMSFSSNGSPASNIIAIDTTSIASTGTLEIDEYTGDYSGDTYTLDGTYDVVWNSSTTTLKIENIANTPTVLTRAATFNMGEFGFQLSDAGSFNDTEISSISFSLIGTGTAADIASVRLYRDSDCDQNAGVLLGTSNYSGNPAKVHFSLSSNDFIIQADPSTPMRNCLYIEYDIAPTATAGKTLGISIASQLDVANDQGYQINPGTSLPLSLGNPGEIENVTETIWTGSVDSNWSNSSNWTNGVPDSSISCQILTGFNNPSLTSSTGSCLNFNLVSGVLNIGVGATLNVYGNFSNNSTIVQNGVIQISGNSGLNQSIQSLNAIESLTFNKTSGGKVTLASSALTVNSMTIPSANDFTFEVGSGKTLTVSSLTLDSALFEMRSGSRLMMTNGGSVHLNGGEFKTSGVADSWPQNLSNKATVDTVSGRWGFSSTSGTLNLKGFIFSQMDENGLLVGGNTNLSLLYSGQFTSLSTNYSNVKAIQLNTTGAIPSNASQIYWTWGEANFAGIDSNNDGVPDSPTPNSTEGYLLVSSSGCASQSIDFSNWTGDWFEVVSNFDYTTKVSGNLCNISLSSPASHVDVRSMFAQRVSIDKVRLSWIATNEKGAWGYNIYRKNGELGSLERLNEFLIPAINYSGQKENTYSFIDTSFGLGDNYYYVQEVSRDPMALSLYGPAIIHLDSQGDDHGTDNPVPPSEDDETEDSPVHKKNLGGGLFLLSQTGREINLELRLPDAVVVEDGGMKNLTLKDYLTVGESTGPKLPYREFLIEIDSESKVAKLGTVSDILIKNFGKLNLIDSESSLLDYVGQNFKVGKEILAINNRHFLRFEVFAATVQPDPGEVHQLKHARIRILLDDFGSSVPPDVVASDDLATSFDDVVEIAYSKKGLYRVVYDDLSNLNLSWLEQGTSIASLRLYYQRTEIPMEVLDHDQDLVWGPGDEIIFYANYNENFYDRYDYVVLADRDLYSSHTDPLRVSNYDGSLDLNEPTLKTHKKKFVIEEEKFHFADKSLDGNDPYFWKKLISFQGYRDLDFVLNLEGISNQASSIDLVVYLYADLTSKGNEVEHELALINNETGEIIAHKYFSENGLLALPYSLDLSNFSKYQENLSLRLTSNGRGNDDVDQVSIDRIEVSFDAENTFYSNSLEFEPLDSFVNIELSSPKTNQYLYLFGFNSEGEPNLMRIHNSTREQGKNQQRLNFFYDDHLSKGVVLNYSDESFLSPIRVRAFGPIAENLKEPEFKIDFLMIGDEKYHDALSPLIELRESQGISTVYVTPSDIYRTFSNSQIDPNAFATLFKAMNSWEVGPARYVMFVGDGTLNTKKRELISSLTGKVIPDEFRASNLAGVLPLPNRSGRFLDFQDIYSMIGPNRVNPYAIGILPFADPKLVASYVQKVLSYEDNLNDVKKSFVGLVGGEEDREGFSQFTYELLNPFVNERNFDVSISDINKTRNPKDFKNSFFKSFDENGPYLLTYMGHGASNTWGNSLIDFKDLGKIPDKSYPVVISLSCDNAYFMNEDTRDISFAEALVGGEKGAIAYLSSTTWTTSVAQHQFASRFFTEFRSITIGNYEPTSLAEILARTRVEQSKNPYTRDLALSMVYVGDPSISIPANLFSPESGNKEISESPLASRGGFGCDVIASDGRTHSTFNDFFGFLEMILLLLLGRLSYRFILSYLAKRLEHLS